jgi:predicted RNA-binding protein with EMAP domain
MIDTKEIRASLIPSALVNVQKIKELCDAYDELKAQLESEKRWAERFKTQRDQVIEENTLLKQRWSEEK